ncbi:structural maintenance of chromosomes protein 2-1, partial [Tanacetum coccineum]
VTSLKDEHSQAQYEFNAVNTMLVECDSQISCSLKVDKLINKHAWITSEKQFFGRSGSNYDFISRDPHRARGQLENLEAQQADHEKRVNKKVMSMFEKTENDYNDLISKKKIIENRQREVVGFDGLEVRVALGDVWKQSLSELSGGQRSLTALSLILALLLFKPAPIYILDEVFD